MLFNELVVHMTARDPTRPDPETETEIAFERHTHFDIRNAYWARISRIYVGWSDAGATTASWCFAATRRADDRRPQRHPLPHLPEARLRRGGSHGAHEEHP